MLFAAGHSRTREARIGFAAMQNLRLSVYRECEKYESVTGRAPRFPFDSIPRPIPNLIVHVPLLQSRLVVHIVIQNGKFAFYSFTQMQQVSKTRAQLVRLVSQTVEYIKQIITSL